MGDIWVVACNFLPRPLLGERFSLRSATLPVPSLRNRACLLAEDGTIGPDPDGSDPDRDIGPWVPTGPPSTSLPSSRPFGPGRSGSGGMRIPSDWTPASFFRLLLPIASSERSGTGSQSFLFPNHAPSHFLLASSEGKQRKGVGERMERKSRVWHSLVVYLSWEQKIAGSNPVTLSNSFPASVSLYPAQCRSRCCSVAHPSSLPLGTAGKYHFPGRPMQLKRSLRMAGAPEYGHKYENFFWTDSTRNPKKIPFPGIQNLINIAYRRPIKRARHQCTNHHYNLFGSNPHTNARFFSRVNPFTSDSSSSIGAGWNCSEIYQL